jgi:hypothetical protein
MAEAIAVISFLSAIASLASYGSTVVTRLNEFRKNVKDLPASFLHISIQLPLLVEIVRRLSSHASQGEIDSETEKLLAPVVQGLHNEIKKLDMVLLRVLPSAKASTWEKGVKAVKSVGAQKDVDEFAAVIRDYVSNLTAFQTTHNSDLIRKLGTFLEEQRSRSPTPEPTPRRSAVWLNRYDSDPDFVGREGTMIEIERQLKEKNHRVALVGIGGVG